MTGPHSPPVPPATPLPATGAPADPSDPPADTDREAARRRTVETRRLLRGARARTRRARRRGVLYTAYCTVLLGTLWGGPPLWALARAGATGRLDGPVAALPTFVPVALPALLPALWAAVVLALVLRGVRWGPPAPDRATIAHLLAHPLERRALLLPRLVTSAALRTVTAAGAGAVGGLLVFAVGAGGPVAAPFAGALAGGSAGWVGTCLAVPAQRVAALAPARYRRIIRAARGGTALLVLPVLAGALAPGGDGYGETARRLPAWSGPWGWATLPVTTGPGTPGGGGWGVPTAGYLLTLATAVAVGWWAARALERVPTRLLRERADASPRVRAARYTLDLRAARMAGRPPRRLSPTRAPHPVSYT
ncbi:hypothetical protein FNX48_014150, partial [Streptomyces sp. IF17]|nr:hypothetical protein [Streptomyces alkaliphilus]